MAMATAQDTVEGAATKTDATSRSEQFARARHLAFACIGLLQAPLSEAVWPAMPLLVETSPWTAELDVLTRLIPTCFVVLVAFLAFEVCDTRSGVTIFPRRWRDIGPVPILAFVTQESTIAWLLTHKSPEVTERLVAKWTSYYTSPDGTLMVGWVIAAGFAGAIAEEIVHRALLLRALEGYVNRGLALVIHAFVFEGVHVFIYGYGFDGGIWFIAALIYGYAFQRTRALAPSVLMHASSWLIFFASIWYASRYGS